MIKNEVLHTPEKGYAIVTGEAFEDDVRGRIALQWFRANKQVRAAVVELPRDECRPLLPGILASYPNMRKVIVRCWPGQEAAVRAFVPFHVASKVEYAGPLEVLDIGVVEEAVDEEGDMRVRLETIYPPCN